MPNDLNVTISGQPIAVTVSGPTSPTVALNVQAGPVATVSGIQQQSSLASLQDVALEGLASGDVLRYSSNKWRNYPDINLTDGGHF